MTTLYIRIPSDFPCRFRYTTEEHTCQLRASPVLKPPSCCPLTIFLLLPCSMDWTKSDGDVVRRGLVCAVLYIYILSYYFLWA